MKPQPGETCGDGITTDYAIENGEAFQEGMIVNLGTERKFKLICPMVEGTFWMSRDLDADKLVLITIKTELRVVESDS